MTEMNLTSDETIRLRLEENGISPMRMNLFQWAICIPKDMPGEKAAEIVESVSPAGTSGGWQFDSKLPPAVCNDNPNRLHITLAC
jgi:hypothetical protein